MTDVWSALQSRLRADAGRPLVTSIDTATGARVELSGASVANAAAKIANALRDAFDLEQGAVVGLDLPVHWQRTAWCAGAWTAGCLVVPDPDPATVDLLVTSADRAADASDAVGEVAVVSLHPFGLPIAEPLPPGCVDVTLAVRQQPDAYLFDPPSGRLAAMAVDGRTVTQAELLDLAAARAADWGLVAGGTLLAADGLGPMDAWLAALPVPLAARASVVLVNGDADLQAVEQAERVTARAS